MECFGLIVWSLIFDHIFLVIGCSSIRVMISISKISKISLIRWKFVRKHWIGNFLFSLERIWILTRNQLRAESGSGLLLKSETPSHRFHHELMLCELDHWRGSLRFTCSPKVVEVNFGTAITFEKGTLCCWAAVVWHFGSDHRLECHCIARIKNLVEIFKLMTQKVHVVFRLISGHQLVMLNLSNILNLSIACNAL